MNIRVIGLNSPPYTALQHVSGGLARAFNVQVIVETRSIKIPQDFVDPARNQYRALKVVEWVALNFRGVGDEVVLAVVNGDGYVEGLNFVFGLALPPLNAAAVFFERLKFMADEHLFLKRLLKESMHELGHVFGLRHCSTPGCVMRFSNSVIEVDEKSWRFCRKCFNELVARGINVSHEALLK